MLSAAAQIATVLPEAAAYLGNVEGDVSPRPRAQLARAQLARAQLARAQLDLASAFEAKAFRGIRSIPGSDTLRRGD